MTETILDIHGLKKYFSESDSLIRRLRPDQTVNTVRAVDGVDLSVRDGETLGLVGESGCGKSTLARAAIRLLEPTEGEVYYRDEEVTGYSREELRQFRSEVQMIFQDPFASLNPRYSVEKTLTEPMRVHDIGSNKRERRQRAMDLLERCGLGAEHVDRHPHEFSGGQRQRIAIARALAVEPQLIVADEPVSALDVSVQAQILNLLSELKADMGLSMLFISHDMSVVRRVCDRVAVMYLGEIAEVADTATLFAEPRHPYTQALLSSIPVPDPTVERDRISLEGDVPTPIDPPSGCRFHPRCPKVIPPEEWDGSQEAWRRTLGLATRIRDDEIDPEATRDHLAAEGEDSSTNAVIDAIYEEHVTRSTVADAESVSLPSDGEATVRDALGSLVEGDQAAAIDTLENSFSTVCAKIEPDLDAHGAADGKVSCHLHDPEIEVEDPTLGADQEVRTDGQAPQTDTGADTGANVR